jgi:hypothetical protein
MTSCMYDMQTLHKLAWILGFAVRPSGRDQPGRYDVVDCDGGVVIASRCSEEDVAALLYGD